MRVSHSDLALLGRLDEQGMVFESIFRDQGFAPWSTRAERSLSQQCSSNVILSHIWTTNVDGWLMLWIWQKYQWFVKMATNLLLNVRWGSVRSLMGSIALILPSYNRLFQSQGRSVVMWCVCLTILIGCGCRWCYCAHLVTEEDLEVWVDSIVGSGWVWLVGWMGGECWWDESEEWLIEGWWWSPPPPHTAPPTTTPQNPLPPNPFLVQSIGPNPIEILITGGSTNQTIITTTCKGMSSSSSSFFKPFPNIFTINMHLTIDDFHSNARKRPVSSYYYCRIVPIKPPLITNNYKLPPYPNCPNRVKSSHKDRHHYCNCSYLQFHPLPHPRTNPKTHSH